MNNSPILLLEGTYTESDLKDFHKRHKIWKVVDVYKEQIAELFEISNPQKVTSTLYDQELKDHIKHRLGKNPEIKGNWIYFPWNGYLIHSVNEREYFELRTNRNKHIISDKEQNILYNSCVGFLGLSIGQQMVLSLVYNGIAKNLKLAEFDTLSTTNLNRVRAGLKDIGRSKSELLNEYLYEINPYQNIHNFHEGLNEKTIHDFFDLNPKPKLVFEACDDFKMKIRIRIEAKKRKIPVIMLTNLADSILIDIERYDADPDLPIFHGILGELPEEIINGEITEKDKIRYAKDLVGTEFLPTRVLHTLHEINKTVVGRPQLGSTVTVSGGLASYLARRILLEKHVWSGRKHVSFHDIFGFDEEKDEVERIEIIEKLNNLVRTNESK